MSTTVWFRETIEDEWRPASPFHTDIPGERAHAFADRKNTSPMPGMWWVSTVKPSDDTTL